MAVCLSVSFYAPPGIFQILLGAVIIAVAAWLFDAFKKTPLTGSESVFGFAAWLTTREQDITLGATHDAAPVADLCEEFCRTNDLADPRDNWGEILRHPRSDHTGCSGCYVPAGENPTP